MPILFGYARFGMLRAISLPAARMTARGEDLHPIGGIGLDLSAKLHEIANTGTCALLAELRHKVPVGLLDMLTIPGIGPQRVRMLHDALHVDTLDELRKAAKAGKVRTVPGLWAKTERQIFEAIDAQRSKSRRFLLPDADQNLQPLLAWLKLAPGIHQAVGAGSYRRMRDTVGDLDILVTSSDPSAMMQHFEHYEDIDRMLASGSTRASAVLRGGMQVDLRVVSPERFDAALVYLTGSRAQHRHQAHRSGSRHEDQRVWRVSR
jgi:DNA polymerase (family 10)